MRKIEIKNERLKVYLEYELDKKKDEVIYENELEKINQITIFGKSISDKKVNNDLSDLLYFKQLKYCTIKDFLIKDEEIEIINQLENLEELHFDNCIFENKYKNIKIYINKLILSFCTNINMSLFSNRECVEYLRITSGNKIKLDGIEYFTNIKELYLQSQIIKDIFFINELKKLTYLNLNGSKIIKNKKCIEKLNIMLENNKNNFPK